MNTNIPPQIVTGKSDLRAKLRAIRESGKSAGLVPTMGALHAGHLSLVRRSNERCDTTIVTIFVNPTQFGPQEDFERYPRTLTADLQALSAHHVDLVFAPHVEELYPAGFSTFVDPPDVALPLEGECRSNHFRGVTTIVMKLFQLTTADVAFFGQKDYQQALVIQRMGQDLDVPIEIEVCPIVRESDGLAMSSRNKYLTPPQREQALAISRSLRIADRMVTDGQVDTEKIQQRMRAEIATAGIKEIEYIAIVDSQTLQPITRVEKNAIALVAAMVGTTRLIDNQLLA